MSVQQYGIKPEYKLLDKTFNFRILLINHMKLDSVGLQEKIVGTHTFFILIFYKIISIMKIGIEQMAYWHFLIFRMVFTFFPCLFIYMISLALACLT